MNLRMVALALGTLVLAANTAVSQEARIRITPKPVTDGSATQVQRMDPAQMLRLTLVLQLTGQDELQKFVRDVQDPTSPRFRQFLTFDQWKARYAPADADLAKVDAWAGKQGLKVIHHFRDNLAMKVEANAQSIEQAFNVQLKHYKAGTRTFFSNDRDPVIPAELTRILKNVHGLSNYVRFHAASHGSAAIDDNEPIYKPGPFLHRETARGDGAGRPIHRSARAAVSQAAGNPTENISGGLGSIEVLDLYSSEAYDLGALQRFSQCCNPNHNPSGSPKENSIAIIGQNSINSNDLATFAAQYGMAYNLDQVMINSPSCCDDEMTLDIESATGMANNFGYYKDTAHVYAYEGGGSHLSDGLDAWHQAHSDDNARNASSSFGSYEDAFGGAGNPSISDFTDVINAMASEGWSIAVATGDHGATQDCQSLSVTFPASSPNVLAVGGTSLTLTNNAGKPKFGSEVTWDGNGCGTTDPSAAQNLGGGGGGCSNTEPRGFYQEAFSETLCGGKRSLPDVALNSGTLQEIYYGGWKTFVGTSIAAPEVAGFFAHVNSYLTSLGNICGGTVDQPCAPIGPLNTMIWLMGITGSSANGHYPLYDITSGCNGGEGATGYCALTGYDQATGWGSFNMFQLAWAINDVVTHGVLPEVNFSGPTTNTWYNVDRQVNFTLSSPPPTGTNASLGIAGYTAQWDAPVADVLKHATPGSGDPFYSGPAKTGTSDSLSLLSAGLGCHTAHVFGWDNAGQTTGDQTYGPVCYDNQPPNVSCGTADGFWHATDVSIACSASDQPNLSGLANAADASFVLSTSVPAGTETAGAQTNSRAILDKAGNSATAGPIGSNKVDKKPPTVNCGTPDGAWHANNIAIPCTASDGGSGLANLSDASFNLSTSVPAGTETTAAFTNSHAVLDVVSNGNTAGPLGPNKIDRKPPTITINQPTATPYTHSSTLTLNYTVNDYGSGLAAFTPTMNGNLTAGGLGLSSGTMITLLTHLPLGPNTFTISATDNVGNNGSASVVFTIIVTAQSMIDDVKQFFANGAISDPSVYSGLLDKLNAAASARRMGQCNTASNNYSAFINQVMAQTGKGVTAQAAAILISDARYMITHCP